MSLRVIFLFFLLANGFSFSMFVARGTIVSWYILEKTNSTFIVGLITAIPTMALPILSPLGGKLADSVSRKSVVLAVRTVLFIVMITMAISVNQDYIPITLLVITSILFGLIASLEGASNQNLIIDILGIENLSKGNGWKELSNSGLNALLPLLIGALFTILSSSQIFWILPGIGLLGLFFALLLFIYFKPPEDHIQNSQTFKEVSIKDSILYVKNNENIRILLLLGFGMMLFWAFPQPLLPKYSKDTLEIGGSGYAILSSCYFAGSMIGALLITFSVIKIKSSQILIMSTIIYCVFTILFYISTSPVIGGLLILASGLSHSIWWISILVFLQTLPKESHKGRIVGFFFGLLVSIGVGSILGGLMAEYIGVTMTVIFAMVSLVIIHSIAFASSEKFRQLNLLDKGSF